MTNKERVLRKYPNAGAAYYAMWGVRIINYREDGYGQEVLSGPRATHHRESAAWADAAKRLKNTRSTDTRNKR